ncbi:UDP-glucosyltransferase 2 [Drosophila albomicans]|uniref:UDP-glucosyltransferase 2 n=1 Tax=Drosophila albomicans TaxID=7291 RepID=A0A6P8WL88_DROAB|nr:UDP-glucosyltransferase 2 [Drosophila albomicans]
MKLFVALLLSLLLLGCYNWQQLQAANILCIVGTAEENNPAWSEPFFEALVDRGHKLTIVGTTTDPEIKGIEHIQIKNNYNANNQYVKKDNPAWHGWDIKQMLNWNEAVLGNCRAVIQNEHLDALKGYYDLIIYDATYTVECLLTRLPQLHNKPILALSGGKLTADLLRLVNAENTINPARIPYFASKLPLEMSYWQRIQNHLIYFGQSAIRWGVVEPVLRGMLPNFRQPAVQIVLLNTHPVLDYVQNLPPNVIEVGGLHIRAESSALSLDLQSFVERFPEGLVYIHLPHLKQFTDSGVQAIQDMLKEFTQFGFILNSKLELARKFNNLKTVEVDNKIQLNILAQSNVKAFISHGDSFGLQEAIYNAVPVIMLPLLFDQFNNAKRIEERELGIRITANSTGYYDFGNALQRIVREPTFSTNLQQAQFNFRTRKMKPVNEAIWYVEQLVADADQFKHLSHSQSAEQSYFVSHSIDVLLLPVLFVSIFIINLIVLIHQVVKTKNPNKDKTKLIEKKFKEKLKELEKKKSTTKIKGVEKKKSSEKVLSAEKKQN